MRLTGGTLGGRILHVPAGAAFRPSTDRVRESLFNIVSQRLAWEGLTVLDLFAGSGSLGMEAMSRGASSATFVESRREHILVLRRNLDTLALTGRCTIEAQAVEHFLARNPARFDLVLADPPYDYSAYPELLAGMIPLLRDEDGIAVLEHRGGKHSPDLGPWIPFDRREYGTTGLSLFHGLNGAKQ